MSDTEATAPMTGLLQGVPRSATLPAPAGVAAPVRRRGPARAVLSTMRPQQWIKNLLVIAAAGAAGALGDDDVPVRVGLAFCAFCLLASGIYAVNDVRDVAEDRLHPRKRFRAVAAGELDPALATMLGAGLIAAGLGLCFAIRPLLAVVGVGYVALTLSYTLVWRHLLVLDIVAIAGGFVLRAVAGGVAAPVTLSKAFLIVVSGAAVFVAAGKRQAELRRTDAEADPREHSGRSASRRRVLEGYTPRRLQLILVGGVGLTAIAYCYWALEVPSVDGVPWRPLTILPVLACLGRYWMLIRRGQGEAPEDLLLHDRPLALAAVAWFVLFALGVHAAA